MNGVLGYRVEFQYWYLLRYYLVHGMNYLYYVSLLIHEHPYSCGCFLDSTFS